MSYTLYIGDKNYSTWSLRAWVLMQVLGIPFQEQRLSLYLPESAARIRQVSPSSRLPCLHHGRSVVWDSLAIAEYLAERHPGVWPADAHARAWARCAAAEMHSGFGRLRDELGMDVRLRRARLPSAAAAADIGRLVELWSEGRQRFGGDGDFLCGAFSAVDAFFCPVAFRFQTYRVALDAAAAAYARALLALPAMQDWAAAAERESETALGFDPPGLGAQQQ